MSQASTSTSPQLRRAMGFWDVLLFNIAAVLGPRWIAAAAHNGTSSISLWILAAVLFFLPTALVIIELSTRYPAEGGLYVWSKEAFGDFHGFVAGWAYWIYTFFYFPGLLTASVAMSVYIGGPKYAWLASNSHYLLWASLGLLGVAVVLNIVGLDIGKWLQNAGGVATYAPLLMLVGIALYLGWRHGSTTQFSWKSALPHWDWDTVNFWSNIAFAFTGMELVCAMSEEVHEPRRTFPRAIYSSAALIAAMYIIATVALLVLLPAGQVDVRSGVFQAISNGSAALGIAWFGIVAALLVTVGNAGGVGSTVAGVARIPFVAGIDRYLPSFFGKIHPRWKTPWISILVQAGISAVILVLTQLGIKSVIGAYQFLVSMSVILYFIPFLYMYAAVIKLAYRPDRATPGAVLVPGGKAGVWLTGLLGFLITGGSMALACVPPGEEPDKVRFVASLILSTVGFIGFGLLLYWRGARSKKATGN
ncbi:MAG TPA: APC family permease [Candidatus Limnocylindrales bacterium]|nr:APC family permease [Candidatus Limnocylindrales bacterium]